MLKAPVPVVGSQIAFCAIQHVIKLIEDCEPSFQLGYRRRLRILPLRRDGADRWRTRISAPRAAGTYPRLRLVAPDNDTSTSREFGWSKSIHEIGQPIGKSMMSFACGMFKHWAA